MIATLLLALNLQGCPDKVKIYNKSNLPINKHDRKTAEFVTKRCPVFDKNRPCVRFVVKLSFQNYYVHCGFRRPERQKFNKQLL